MQRFLVHAILTFVFLGILLTACGPQSSTITSAPAVPTVNLASPTSASAATATVPSTAAPPPPSPTVAASPTSAPSPTAAPTTSASTYPLSFQDDHKRSITVVGQPKRIVSLAPSCTEILFAVGAGQQVVAVDQFSNYPATAASKPKVGGLQANLEQILALNPDLVCAAGITPDSLIQSLGQAKVTVVVLDAQTIPQVLGDITLAGRVVGHPAIGNKVAADVQSRISAAEEKVAGAARPRVYDELDATDPSKPYTVGPGSFVDGLITAAGGQNVFSQAQSPYPQVNLEEVLHLDPQIILLSDAQYGVTAASVGKRVGWAGITAVKNHAVYPIDADLVSRPGPRIADAVEAMAKLFHPNRFK